MESQPARGLLDVLQQVLDPRGRKGQRHACAAMLAVMICATMSGYGGFRPALRWLKAQGLSFWHALGGTRSFPSRGAFQNLLAEIDPDRLYATLRKFIEEIGVPLSEGSADDVEVWDGKILRGTRSRHAKTEQLLVRFDLALGSTLSTTRIESQTNEIKAAQTLLLDLMLKGKIVVGDAIYCQREICQEIVDQQGFYLFTVKDNQPQLHRDIQQAFVIPEGFSPLCS